MEGLTRRAFGLGVISVAATTVVKSNDDPDLAKLVQSAKESNAQASRARMQFGLPEGSEPSFMFVPWEPKA